VPEIVDIGIAALKIEGRYKDSDYVALATRAYRRAVDDAWDQLPLSVTREDEIQLEQVYSRGLGPHFLTGTNHQAVVEGRAPRHRGVLAGRVQKVTTGAVTVAPAEATRIAPLKPGDGVVFDAAEWRSPEEAEEGGRIYEVSAKPSGSVELRFGNRAVNFERIRPGDLLWRTHDAEIDKAAKPFTEAAAPVRKQWLHVRVVAKEGECLWTEWKTVGRSAVSVTVQSEAALGRAQNRALDGRYLQDQLGRLGNTPYQLGDIELQVEGKPFAPSSLLNQVRREAVERLQELQSNKTHAASDPLRALDRVADSSAVDAVVDSTAVACIHLLVRTPEQMEAAIAVAPASITLDYLDLYGLLPSVDRVKRVGIECRVASPRVLKPGEERIVNFLLRLDCPILVRSTGLIEHLRGRTVHPLIGDFSLNAANSVTTGMLLKDGVARVTPTHDLNAEQVAELARRVGPRHIEAIAYQHLPVFHTEHCVFCRFMSSGTSYKDCGRPCEKHKVAVRDVNGRAHPVLADVGCRNTVFGAEAQEASVHLDAWRKAGIHHFRLEFAHETGDEVRRIASAFADTLTGRRTSQQLSQALKQIAPQGTTEGSLFVPKDYLTLPVLQ
jgi:putative protease